MKALLLLTERKEKKERKKNNSADSDQIEQKTCMLMYVGDFGEVIGLGRLLPASPASGFSSASTSTISCNHQPIDIQTCQNLHFISFFFTKTFFDTTQPRCLANSSSEETSKCMLLFFFLTILPRSFPSIEITKTAQLKQTQNILTSNVLSSGTESPTPSSPLSTTSTPPSATLPPKSSCRRPRCTWRLSANSPTRLSACLHRTSTTSPMARLPVS